MNEATDNEPQCIVLTQREPRVLYHADVCPVPSRGQAKRMSRTQADALAAEMARRGRSAEVLLADEDDGEDPERHDGLWA